jgi:fructokinase
MRAGIDFGGTKVEAILMDEHGRGRGRRRLPSPPEGTQDRYGAALETVAVLLDALETDVGTRARVVGLGLPGSPSPRTGLIRNANSVYLNGRPFVADLAARLGRPVRAANDANCFALSEARDGAAAGAASVFGVILGTGCGGGLVLEGRVIDGAGGIAGEWGHIPLPWATPEEHPGRACWCGRTGCMETWVSGPAVLADHHARLLAAGRGAEIDPGDSATQIAARAQGAQRCTLAAATIEALVSRLARGLASIVNVLDPEVVVLGGGVSRIPGLATRVGASMGPWVFSDAPSTRVVCHRHGDSSGVRGAAWLFSAEEAARTSPALPRP